MTAPRAVTGIANQPDPNSSTGCYVYPAFQIGADGLLPGVRDVLDAFAIADPWTRVNFMLTSDARLGGRRPVDVLREGDIASVVRAARAYGEHGA